MLKNLLPALIVFAAVTASSSAALPPKYLGIKDFKLCLATQEINTYRAWCMPAGKPESCPAASWEQLKALTGTDKLPDCPAGSTAPAEKPATQ
ncbi:hypothetical protein SAMN05660284_00026 [Formivibrio citricus]|uniref:Uncharacterized protein n=1 Tax=Formivibrio citricus TaxID=83765 RepID=A0A1I4UXK7_9NEIS|nr:hypothetical protein [Formivibrio citricus]SFM93714.1 hypothetical protein SAMN05660284_00026 [Formivibrio citricus]